jgi:hypothetical protein
MASERMGGRWFLTICAGAALLMLTLAHCLGQPSISPEALSGIIVGVFTLYFGRTDRPGAGNGGGAR